MTKPTKRSVRDFAKEHLGLEELRPGQKEAILATLRHRDTRHFTHNATVTHSEWGDGKVMQNEEDTITVRFDSVGYKTLANDLVEREGLLTLKERAGAPGS